MIKTATDTAIESFERLGYAIIDLLDEAQHRHVEGLLCNRLRELAKQELDLEGFDPRPLAEYHRRDLPDEAHKRMMAARHRYIRLDEVALSALLQGAAVPVFEHFWGHPKVSMVYWLEDVGRIENACMFRVVQPGGGDVSGIHSESSYGVYPMTLWVPIVGFDERYTLKIAPGSHVYEHPKEEIQRDARFIARPYSDAYLSRFTLVRPVMRKGQAIAFHPNLIHGGSANLGETTRVSIEARIYETGGSLSAWPLLGQGR